MSRLPWDPNELRMMLAEGRKQRPRRSTLRLPGSKAALSTIKAKKEIGTALRVIQKARMEQKEHGEELAEEREGKAETKDMGAIMDRMQSLVADMEGTGNPRPQSKDKFRQQISAYA